MQIRRFLCSALLGVLAVCGTLAFAVERPVAYLYSTVGSFPGAEAVKFDAALASWRQTHESVTGADTRGLRAEGHHLVQASILPQREEDWL